MVKAQVDRDRCFGFGRCVEEVPEVFRLDEDHKSVPQDPTDVEVERLLAAAWSCPMQAISVHADDGSELPESAAIRGGTYS